MVWKTIREKWDTMLLIIAITSAVFTFMDMRAEAMDAKKKVEQLAEIAADLRDPDLWLRNYLLNHGVDSLTAKTWSRMQKGPVPDSTGAPLPNIPFLDRYEMPERGVLMILTPADSVVVLDTLWSFVPERKECKKGEGD